MGPVDEFLTGLRHFEGLPLALPVGPACVPAARSPRAAMPGGRDTLAATASALKLTIG